jgi:hypothetical protein
MWHGYLGGGTERYGLPSFWASLYAFNCFSVNVPDSSCLGVKPIGKNDSATVPAACLAVLALAASFAVNNKPATPPTFTALGNVLFNATD